MYINKHDSIYLLKLISIEFINKKETEKYIQLVGMACQVFFYSSK